MRDKPRTRYPASLNRFILLLAVLALILGAVSIPGQVSAAQGPYTITFDEYPQSIFGNQITEQYASLGIHFTNLPSVDPPMTTPFYNCSVYSADPLTWPTTPFSFLPIPPGQFLAFDKPQGANANNGVGMMFDYYCSQIGFRYRRPGNTATAYTLFLVQFFDTAKSKRPFYTTQIQTVVKPPPGSDSGGYLPFSLAPPAPFNMVVFAATKKFQIEDLTITPSASSSKPTLDDPYPSLAGNVLKAGQSCVVDSTSVGPNFVWSGKKPDGTPLDLWDPAHPTGAGGIGKDTGMFVAPSDGNFAGTYNITVTYTPTGTSRSFNVVVPVNIVADDALIFKAGVTMVATFHAYGADVFSPWTTFPDNLSATPGTWETKSDGGKTNNKLEFTPAGALSDDVVFRLKAVAAGDTNQDYVGYSPKVFVLPMGTLSGRLSDAAASLDPDIPAVDWSSIQAIAKLIKAEGGTTKAVAADGSFSFSVPKLDGLGGVTTYSVRVTADGYVPQTFNQLSPGGICGLIMTQKAGSISGNVKSGGANLDGATVVAYKEVTVNGALKKESSEPILTDAAGNFTINLQTSPTDHVVNGTYTVVASKDGYEKAVVSGIVISSGLKDVTAANYAGLNASLTQKTLLINNRKEWDHDSDPLTPMVTDLSFTARQTAFTGTGDLTGPTLVALTVDGTNTTNLGSLGPTSLSGSSITCRYTPSPSDSLIGIQAQAYAAKSYRSDLVDYSFFVHPDSGASSNVTTIAPVDPNVGTTVGDASQTALVEIPFNGLTALTAASVLIERVGSTDATVQGSDIVVIAIEDGSGNDLGNVVNADNPIEITMQFDPKLFDPSKFTIYYRSKTGGSWGAWVDGVKDGTITLSSIDLINNMVTFKATHLTAFGIGVPAAAAGGGDGGGGGSGGDGGGGSPSGSLSPIGGPGVSGAGCFISTILE